MKAASVDFSNSFYLLLQSKHRETDTTWKVRNMIRETGANWEHIGMDTLTQSN